jgi:hypothetical protein
VVRSILEYMFDIETQTNVSGWVSTLAGLAREVVSDAERIDRIRELEDLRAAAAAAQVRLSADFEASQRQAQIAARVPARRLGEGIAAQIALARRESPVRGAQHLGLAKTLTTEMPDTLRAMTQGRLSEWRATLLVRETACLTAEDRRTVDAALCADPRTLEGLSDQALVAEAKRLAYRLDPDSVVRRNRNAETERTVTIRPAPDTMSWITALLPVTQGVALYAAGTNIVSFAPGVSTVVARDPQPTSVPRRRTREAPQVEPGRAGGAVGGLAARSEGRAQGW